MLVNWVILKWEVFLKIDKLRQKVVVFFIQSVGLVCHQGVSLAFFSFGLIIYLSLKGLHTQLRCDYIPSATDYIQDFVLIFCGHPHPIVILDYSCYYSCVISHGITKRAGLKPARYITNHIIFNYEEMQKKKSEYSLVLWILTMVWVLIRDLLNTSKKRHRHYIFSSPSHIWVKNSVSWRNT